MTHVSQDPSPAIGGYDPVCYFTKSTATPGTLGFSHEWDGQVWHFESAQTREMFAADPHQYAPQFGGKCAFGTSLGREAASSPEAWRIIDGRLFLLKSKAVRAISHLADRKMVAAADSQESP